MDFKITTTVSGGAKNYAKTQTVSGGQRITINETIPASSTDLAVAFAMVAAKGKSLVIESTKNLTVETNSAGSPANTFTLVANVPYIWPQVAGEAFKDTAAATVTNITALYVTNAGLVDAVLSIDALVDPT